MAEPEWSDLKVILALGQSGSVAGAARILAVDASTVSRRLTATEKAMGAVLIVRGGREFTFTTEGKAALAAAQAMDKAVTEASTAVRLARTDLQGIIRIACSPAVIYFLDTFQNTVSQAHPDLGIELLSGRAPADLARGEADIAIRSLRPNDLDLVVAHRFDLGSCVYAAKSYLSAYGHPSSFAEVRQHKLVRYNDVFLHLPAFKWIEEFADPAQLAVRVDSIDMARNLIASGRGIGALFCTVGDTTPGVIRVFDEPIDQMACCIVYHQSARGSARLRAVLDLLIEYFVARRNDLSGQRPEQ
ncbi:MAG: LysR family transcriptional regulator [Alphaproteobacteria bacterium]|nr:LysR family transcriptional regulator [Alphaproteobacteria bacterium]